MRRILTFVVIIFCVITLLVIGIFSFNAHNNNKAQYKKPDKDLLSNQGDFHWPEGKRAAISLSFDDARPSHLDRGLAILDRYGVKATFYVTIPGLKARLADWQKALATGHEIGNHSLTHPCTTNYTFYNLTHRNGLEDYTLEMMQRELDEANATIAYLLGVRPTTFAYPCGQKFVGRGLLVKSYVPLVAERFIVGRGYLDESSNDPVFCDLSQVLGMTLDDLNFDQVKKLIDETVKKGKWLILCGHEIGKPKYHSTSESTLEAILQYAQNPDNGIWIDTVHAVGRYVLQEQIRIKKSKQTKSRASVKD